jgi:hypothetical protein
VAVGAITSDTTLPTEAEAASRSASSSAMKKRFHRSPMYPSNWTPFAVPVISQP